MGRCPTCRHRLSEQRFARACAECGDAGPYCRACVECAACHEDPTPVCRECAVPLFREDRVHCALCGPEMHYHRACATATGEHFLCPNYHECCVPGCTELASPSAPPAPMPRHLLPRGYVMGEQYLRMCATHARECDDWLVREACAARKRVRVE